MRHLSRKVIFVVAATAIAVLPLAAQAPAQKPQFEVASVKPNKSGKPLPTVGIPFAFLPGGRFTATNVTLVDVIVRVYPTRRIQIQGGPNWIDAERFDIVAKADEAEGKPPQKQIEQMVQALLEDRFQLRFHVEKKEMQAYGLVVGKDTPKLTEPMAGEVPGLIIGDGYKMVFQNMPVVGLVNTMSNILHTPVVDSTSIQGFYDFTLDPFQFLTPAGSSGAPKAHSYDIGNAVMAAVQEQLGFKLERRKELLDITVIDHAERPGEN